MLLRAITWNLYHGRDAPPDPGLFTWRSRLLRISERNDTHIQVNRDLYAEFSAVLRRVEWDVALLQECPPRWTGGLARDCGAGAHRVLTARNSLGAVRALLARLNPDLIASAEGGSNLTLARPPHDILERRDHVLRVRRPERRTMAFSRLASGICVANLHATNERPELAVHELIAAAEHADRWAADDPLIFGGDFNLRPDWTPEAFAALAARFGLAPPTGDGAIDHLLVRGLDIVEPPRPLPAQARELRLDGRAVRLSDHAPVSAVLQQG